MLSKVVNNKKYALKLVFFNKKNQKDSDDFLTPLHYTNLQNTKISFDYS